MIVMFFRINKHTFLAVNNITRKLNGSSNSTMDDINQITGYVQQFNNTLRPAIEGRLASIQSKLAALKQRIAKVRFSIAFFFRLFTGERCFFDIRAFLDRNSEKIDSLKYSLL